MVPKAALALALAIVVAAGGLWLGLRSFSGEPMPPGGGSRAVATGDTVPDLMMDLGLIPLDPRAAKAFTLPMLDGKRLALAELAGRPLLLYFWASW